MDRYPFLDEQLSQSVSGMLYSDPSIVLAREGISRSGTFYEELFGLESYSGKE